MVTGVLPDGNVTLYNQQAEVTESNLFILSSFINVT